jgi:hypothetical protein
MNYSNDYQNNVLSRETYKYEYKESFNVVDIKEFYKNSFTQIQVAISKYLDTLLLDSVMVSIQSKTKKKNRPTEIYIIVYATFDNWYFCCELEEHEDALDTTITNYINENIMEQ